MSPMEEEPGTSRRPTMRDVAALAGVSLKTVARVVNGEPNVSRWMHLKVQEAIDTLDYSKSSPPQRRPVGSSSHLVVVVDSVNEPFQSTLTDAIASIAYTRGYSCYLTATRGDISLERDVLRHDVCRSAAGVAILPGYRGERNLAHIDFTQLPPAVVIDRPVSSPRVDTVLSDNVNGSLNAVRHLSARGHARIAVITGDRELFTARERFEGYQRGLSEAGLGFDSKLVKQAQYAPATLRRMLADLSDLDSPPTAIFTATGTYTINTLRLVGRHGPAIIGFDDFPLADRVGDGISVVAQFPGRMGAVAAQMLFARIDGDESASKHLRVKTELILRKSTLGRHTPLAFT